MYPKNASRDTPAEHYIGILEAQPHWRYQDERREFLRDMQDRLVNGMISPVDYAEQVLADWHLFCAEKANG